MEFESREEQKCSLLNIVSIGSGDHPASYPTGNGGSSQGIKHKDKFTFRLYIS
jgi:hypothetical protein